MPSTTPNTASIPRKAPRILAYGHDEVLLQTRCMVLRHAGFDVSAATSAEEFEACVAEAKISYALYLVGHTILPEEQGRIAKSVVNSTTVVYRLTEMVTPQELIDEVSKSLIRGAP